MQNNIYEYVKTHLNYNNAENYQMFARIFSEEKSAINELDKEEQEDLQIMYIRCMQIIYLENWLNTHFSELDCIRYITDSVYCGEMFGFKRDDWKDVFDLAKNGQEDAAFFLGNQFIENKFSPALSVYASKWYRIAAEKENRDAMWELGLCYRWGTGGEFIDIDKAFYWFEKAAELGHKDAKDILEKFNNETGKNILEQSAISGADGFGTKWYNSKEMVDEYYRLAAEGDVEAQYELGRQLTPGIAYGAFERSAREAAKYYEMAANQGMIDAMFNLANLYINGDIDFDINLEKGFFWRKKCADAGDIEACYMLGKMYYEGKGTKVDEQKGEAYMQKAADEGFKKAVAFLKERIN